MLQGPSIALYKEILEHHPELYLIASEMCIRDRIIGIAIGALAFVGLIAGYFMWYVPYAKDRDALLSLIHISFCSLGLF